HRLVRAHESLRLCGIERYTKRLREQNDIGSSRLSVDADDRVGAYFGGLAPEIGSRILAFAAAVHAGPGAESARPDARSSVRRFQTQGSIGRMRKAGESSKRR